MVISVGRAAVAVAVMLCVGATVARGQCYAARMAADKPRPSEWAGAAVDISGTRVILGAAADGNDGRALIFERTGAREWSQTASITTPDGPDAGDRFGLSVAIEGGFAAVGQPYGEAAGVANGGVVFIYRRVTILGNPVWVLDERLENPNPGVNDRFGFSLDLAMVNGLLTLAVGVPLADVAGNVEAGRVRIFTRSAGGAWSQQDTVVASTLSPGAEFGTSVAMDGPGNRLVVGAMQENAAYVFSRSGSDWGTGFRLSRSGSNDFGSDVAISGNWIAVGSPRDTDGSLFQAGAVYMFARFGSLWVFSDRLLSPTPASNAFLGERVALVGDMLVVSDRWRNQASVWRHGDDGWGLSFPYTLPSDAPGGTHSFGWDVALSDDGANLIVGDRNDSGAGAAYFFTTEQNPASACNGGLLDPVPVVEAGRTYMGCNNFGGTDGSACTASSFDVWYQYTPLCDGILSLSTCGTSDLGGTDTGIDAVLSVHTGCPGTSSNMIACNNDAPSGNDPDACGLFGNLGDHDDAALKVGVQAFTTYRIRVASAGSPGIPGLFVLHVDFTCCRVDWDGNGVVNSTDVSAFINDWFSDQVSGTLVTDYDHNGVVNSTDVSEFVNDWFAGCGV